MSRIKYYDQDTQTWKYADTAFIVSGGGEPYVLPVASFDTLGGIKVSSATQPEGTKWFQTFLDGASRLYTKVHAAEAQNLGCVKAEVAPLTATGPIYIDKDGYLKYVPQEIPEPPKPYELPMADIDILGGVRAMEVGPEDTQLVNIDPETGLLYTAAPPDPTPETTYKYTLVGEKTITKGQAVDQEFPIPILPGDVLEFDLTANFVYELKTTTQYIVGEPGKMAYISAIFINSPDKQIEALSIRIAANHLTFNTGIGAPPDSLQKTVLRIYRYQKQ